MKEKWLHLLQQIRITNDICCLDYNCLSTFCLCSINTETQRQDNFSIFFPIRKNLDIEAAQLAGKVGDAFQVLSDRIKQVEFDVKAQFVKNKQSANIFYQDASKRAKQPYDPNNTCQTEGSSFSFNVPRPKKATTQAYTSQYNHQREGTFPQGKLLRKRPF